MSPMRASDMKKLLITGIFLFAILAIFGWLLFGPGFTARWRNLPDGMTQQAVRNALGTPTSIGESGTMGVHNQPVTRWEYKRGRCIYCVDFDHIGPAGEP